MPSNSEPRAVLAEERIRILELANLVSRAETRDELANTLSELRGVLQEHFAREVALDLAEHGTAAKLERERILADINAEVIELRAEIDGVWREHRAARDALVRSIQRHEESVARALEG